MNLCTQSKNSDCDSANTDPANTDPMDYNYNHRKEGMWKYEWWGRRNETKRGWESVCVNERESKAEGDQEASEWWNQSIMKRNIKCFPWTACSPKPSTATSVQQRLHSGPDTPPPPPHLCSTLNGATQLLELSFFFLHHPLLGGQLYF